MARSRDKQSESPAESCSETGEIADNGKDHLADQLPNASASLEVGL
jgi:hypothetical protein